jgi:magnesium-transporting ATPase (P-type)
MILADDNFASITAAAKEGRTVYNNIEKAMLFLLPTNVAQALVIAVAIFFGFTMPITAQQVLWVNMVTSVAGRSSHLTHTDAGQGKNRLEGG